MEKQSKAGRPKKKAAEKKNSHTVSITGTLKKALVKKYGSLTKAIETVPYE